MFRSQKPFPPPLPLMCSQADFERIFKADGSVDMTEITWFIDQHEHELARYKYLDFMYKGFHSVFEEDEKAEYKPDVRMAVNFPKLLTRSFSGYGYGIPIKVSTDDETFAESIAKFENRNTMHAHEKQMVKLCCKYGHGWEYQYQNENSETRVKAVSPEYCFCVYLDTMSEKALFAVRYGYHTERHNTGAKRIYGEILTPERIIPFEEKKVITDRVVVNPYGMIPIVEWKFDDERMGLYEDVCGAVELLNHTLCEKGNDVDALAEAYLLITGMELDPDQAKDIRDNRLINLFGTDSVKDAIAQFLAKPTADGTQENLLDRLTEIIFTISMVCNFTDDTFGNATSGTALAYKIFNMSNLANDFDLNIEQSIKKRYKLFCSLGTNCSNPNAYEDITVTTTRNLPKNLLEEAQTAQALGDMVSTETKLKVLSIVDDPNKEIERMEEEQTKQADNILSNILFNQKKEVTADEDQPEQS